MTRKLVWTGEAWQQYLYWQRQDKKTLRRINQLLEATRREPISGIGKPEALRGDLSGLLSRRIDFTHRLVYAVSDQAITVVSCRYHY